MMKLAQAWKLVGGLSEPSKMPCHGYSTPAQKCITGAKLRKIADSVCSKCYAFRGNYRFKNVLNAQLRRFKSLTNPLWVQAMTIAIRGVESSGYFRWHDAGDIQSLDHLDNICQVALNLPEIKFWMPTREYGIISQYFDSGKRFPENLTVRLSAYMLEGEPPISLANRLGLTTSGVVKNGFTCPASTQGNKCLSCRACWNQSVENINYKRH